MLRDLTKAPIDPVEDGPDLVTFWHFLTGDRFVESKAFLAPPAVKGRMEESKMKALKYGPVELFASLDGLCGIGQDHIEAIQEWLEVLSELTRPSNKDKQSLDVILGRRNEIYEAYVRGRTKRFSPLWNRYRCQGRYDFDKIQKDLTPFRGLAIYSGVHPALCPIPLAENIEIISGARSLCEAETKGSPISKAPVKRE